MISLQDKKQILLHKASSLCVNKGAHNLLTYFVPDHSWAIWDSDLEDDNKEPVVQVSDLQSALDYLLDKGHTWRLDIIDPDKY